MKREKFIEAKLSEKEKVDFKELKEDDIHSLNKLSLDAEDEKRSIDKQIKKYLSNHTLVLGSEFVALIERQKDVESRIEMIQKIKEDYV